MKVLERGSRGKPFSKGFPLAKSTSPPPAVIKVFEKGSRGKLFSKSFPLAYLVPYGIKLLEFFKQSVESACLGVEFFA